MIGRREGMVYAGIGGRRRGKRKIRPATKRRKPSRPAGSYERPKSGGVGKR